jgi:hypothetical protein
LERGKGVLFCMGGAGRGWGRGGGVAGRVGRVRLFSFLIMKNVPLQRGDSGPAAGECGDVLLRWCASCASRADALCGRILRC